MHDSRGRKSKVDEISSDSPCVLQSMWIINGVDMESYGLIYDDSQQQTFFSYPKPRFPQRPPNVGALRPISQAFLSPVPRPKSCAALCARATLIQLVVESSAFVDPGNACSPEPRRSPSSSYLSIGVDGGRRGQGGETTPRSWSPKRSTHVPSISRYTSV